MWRTILGRAALKKIKFFSDCSSGNHFPGYIIHGILSSINPVGVRKGFPINPINDLRILSSLRHGQHYSFKGYATAADAIDSTDPEDDSSGSEEAHELITKMGKETERILKKARLAAKQPHRVVAGMGVHKYYLLKQRQVKMETEEWERAAKECREILEDMCEQKLAPNLPYVKSLFLGWFEPLRNAIQADLDVFKIKKGRIPYAPYMEQLPADMMAIITMHKMMGLLMTNAEGVGTVKIVNAATQIGEAIEQEARVNRLLQKTKKKKNATHKTINEESEAVYVSGETVTKEMDKLRKQVSTLVKKHNVKQLRGIVKAHDSFKPWGQEAQVKVGARLIQLLMENAYIQTPAEQFDDAPDIRPAFKKSLRNVTLENTKFSRRYGYIECDPLVQKGIDKSARHMVIPYLPMLIPPQNWTG